MLRTRTARPAPARRYPLARLGRLLARVGALALAAHSERVPY